MSDFLNDENNQNHRPFLAKNIHHPPGRFYTKSILPLPHMTISGDMLRHAVWQYGGSITLKQVKTIKEVYEKLYKKGGLDYAIIFTLIIAKLMSEYSGDPSELWRACLPDTDLFMDELQEMDFIEMTDLSIGGNWD